jgi:hypothetical protein
MAFPIDGLNICYDQTLLQTFLVLSFSLMQAGVKSITPGRNYAKPGASADD